MTATNIVNGLLIFQIMSISFLMIFMYLSDQYEKQRGKKNDTH